VACLAGLSVQCVTQRRGAAVGYWGSLMISAVQTGFCGSLTTVSTFVTEASPGVLALTLVKACGAWGASLAGWAAGALGHGRMLA
jgi:fluoride ion exporter CrcB/FEX